jgi:hypothetical protein
VRKLQGAADAAPYAAAEVQAVRAQAGSPPLSRQRRVTLLGG